MKTFIIPFLFIFFLFTLSISTRPDPQTNKPKPNNKKGGGDIGSGYFGPGSGGGGFNIPGFGNNWPGSGAAGGYGGGYGGPKGGHSKSGVIRPTMVCKDKGPCYKKKLTCPAKCFTAYSRSGKGYGGGGGGGIMPEYGGCGGGGGVLRLRYSRWPDVLLFLLICMYNTYVFLMRKIVMVMYYYMKYICYILLLDICIG
ncbi:hypothetical protein HanIR_Chr04g0202891 [Helianthus annuus]|nr:hypothetical protein HanIR_Chr04g0202891 [Helianthus annuus]